MSMPHIERTIHVNYRHQVHFTEGAFDPENSLLRDVMIDGSQHRRHKVLVILDEALATAQPNLTRSIEIYFAAHAKEIRLVSAPIVLEGGERTKNSYFHVSEIHSQIDRHHIDRHSYVICVGGGALLDMVGLAVATAHRGVRHIRIPTTTLSQDDSGVGVKNGINAFGKKNFIGAFAPPYAVVNDFKLLATRGDPFEFGSARPLDFGHWAAHKLEQLSEYRLRHGEAVAIGIALDVIYSRRKNLLDAASADRILRLIELLGFDLYASELQHTDTKGNLNVLAGLEEFREHLGGELTITLLRAIGQGFEVHEVDHEAMIASIHELEQRASQPADLR